MFYSQWSLCCTGLMWMGMANEDFYVGGGAANQAGRLYVAESRTLF